MILIPERKLVLVLVPRTGSGTLKRAVMKRYPEAMLLYRHMEADGVPAGYDRWTKIGVVRSPVARLWSLYKFLQRPSHQAAAAYQAHFERMAASVRRTFEDWLLHNEIVFASPYDHGHFPAKFMPELMVRHQIPENRKSQFIYLRPDLGTQLWQFNELADLGDFLDVGLGHHNRTEESDVPLLSAEARRYADAMFEWDYAVTGGRHV